MNKWFLRSKMVIGLIVMALPTAFAFAGVAPPDDLPRLGELLVQIADALNEVVGVALLIWGTFDKNRSRLTLLPSADNKPLLSAKKGS